MENKSKTLRRNRLQVRTNLNDEEEGIHLDIKRPNTSLGSSPVFRYLQDASKKNIEPVSPYLQEHHKPVQNMGDYSSPPAGLPIIITEKDLVKRQKTMRHFLSINNFGGLIEDIRKKESHPTIQKNATIQQINNVANMTTINYARKKNQGLMLVNELWGQKYHKSIVYATGLKKDEYRLKGQSRKVTSERVKKVENYYSKKNREQIQKEREFIELLVIPVENTESNKELLERLHSDNSESPFRRSLRTPSHRESVKIDMSSRRGTATSPSVLSPRTFARKSQFSGSAYLRNDSASTTDLTSPIKSNFLSDTSTTHAITKEFLLTEPDQSIAGNSLTDRDMSNNYVLSSPSLNRFTFDNTAAVTVSPRLEGIREEMEQDLESPLTKTLRGEYRPKTSQCNSPDTKISLISPTMDQKLHQENKKRMGTLAGSRSDFNNSPSLNFDFKYNPVVRSKGSVGNLQINTASSPPDIKHKHYNTSRAFESIKPHSSVFTGKFQKSGSIGFMEQSTFQNLELEQVRSANNFTQTPKRTNDSKALSAIKLTETSHSRSPSIARHCKATEIGRFKNNFQNLMYYCEEIRNDAVVEASMRETKKSARAMFSSPREKIIDNLKRAKDSLTTEMKRAFSQQKSTRSKSSLALEAKSVKSSRSPLN